MGAIERLLESTLPRISKLAPTQQPQPISCSPVLLFGSMNCFAGLGRDWDFETKVVGRPSFSQGYNVRCRLNRHRLMRGRLKIWQEQQGGGGVSRCWARKREWGVCVCVLRRICGGSNRKPKRVGGRTRWDCSIEPSWNVEATTDGT